MKRKRLLITAAVMAAALLLWLIFSWINTGKIASGRILDKNGLLLREVSSTRDGCAYPVKLNEMPDYFVKILLNTEDRRFYAHHGVDMIAVARAVRQNARSKRRVSGGSTITQQLVRNLYNNPRNIFFKLLETIKAVLVETRYPKKIILEEYLNRIPYGNGAFGVEAASRLYFAKPSRDLSPAESAYLIAVPGATGIYNPYINPEGVLKRQKRILARAYANGAINKKQFIFAVKERVSVYPRERRFLAPHFCDYLIKNFGGSMSKTVMTTLDASIQFEVEKILSNSIKRLKSANVNNAAAVVIENETGAVLAYAGNVDYFDERTSGQIDGVSALRQPGSSVKPFVYAIALESGYTAADILNDMELHIKVRGGGDFSPRNYDKKFHGPVRLRTALACSYNAATVYLADKFGPQRVLEMLRSAGIESLDKKAAFYGPGLCLGNGEVSLLEMTAAFSSLANEGELKMTRLLCAEPATVLSRVMERRTAFIITDILSDNQARQPAFGEFSPLRLPFKCAAKTGTSKDFKDNWALGYTPRYTVGVWAGNFNMEPMYNVSGISGAAPVFRDIMLMLEGSSSNTSFRVPPEIVKRRICPKSGMIPNGDCKEAMDEYFMEGTEPKIICSVHRAYVEKDALGPGIDGEKIYEVYPPEYHMWAKENGIEVPSGELKRSGGFDRQSSCMILYPHDSDVFRLDAVLRKEYQVITLKARTPENTNKVIWKIDGKSYQANQYPFSIPLQLEKGGHEISFTAFSGSSRNQSGIIKIKVL